MIRFFNRFGRKKGGFRDPDVVVPHLNKTYSNNISLEGVDSVLDFEQSEDIRSSPKVDDNPLILSQRPASTDTTTTIESSAVESYIVASMDNKESERITNEDVPSVKEKSDSPDDEDLKEESPSNEDPEIEIDLETLERFKEMYGIDLTEVDFDAVHSQPKLDTTVQRSKVMAVNQEVSTRRLPTKVATKLGSVYPQHRKDLLKLSEDQNRYSTQKSAPAGRVTSDEDVRARLGIGMGNPLAGLASVMKGGLLKKTSPRSSPKTAHKEPVGLPPVALKPTKKPVKAPPMKSVSVDPSLTSRRTEEIKTSTPKSGEQPPEHSTPSVPSPSKNVSFSPSLSKNVSSSHSPSKNVSSSPSRSSDNSGDLSSLFPRGNSHLFDDDEISKWFVGEEKSEDSKTEEKQAAPTKKPAVQDSKPSVPEWKRSLQERKGKQYPLPSKEAKEKEIPAWKKSLLEKKARTTPEPAPPSPKKEPEVKEVRKPEPVPEKKLEPVPEKKLEPVPERKPEPVPEKKPEPVPEKKTEPVLEKKPEPVPEKKTEPVLEKKPEPVPEKKPEPVPEKKPEPVPEKKVEPVSEKTSEIVQEAKPEPVSEEKLEPVPEKQPEPFEEENLEPVSELKPEAVLEEKLEDVSKEEQVSKDEVSVETADENNGAKDQKMAATTEASSNEVTVVPPEVKPSESTVKEAAKKDEVPEWKRKLEERRAARAAEKEKLKLATEGRKAKEDTTRRTNDSPLDTKTTKAAAEEKPKKEKEPTKVEGKARDIKVDKEGPTAKKEEVPTAKKEEIPAAKKEEVPRVKKEEVPRVKKEEVPPVEKEEVPPVKKEEVPPAKKEDIPAAKKEEVPPATKGDVPASKKEDVPEWKKRLEERKAARAAETERIKAETSTKKVANVRGTKTEERKTTTKDSDKKPISAKSTDAVPEWKKQLEERRKQKEAEKAQQQASKSRERAKTVEEDMPSWREKLAKKKADKEATKLEEPSATSTKKSEGSSSLFDEDLLEDSKKPEDVEVKVEDSKDHKSKATIESLFDEDGEDVLFKSKSSPPPVLVEETVQITVVEKSETTPTLHDGESPPEQSAVASSVKQEDSTVLEDWIVVDQDAVKQANEDIAASQTEKEASLKEEEVTSKKEVIPNIRKLSPVPLRKTPSPNKTSSPKSSRDTPSGPSWLEQASKMKESNQSKYSRSKTFSTANTTSSSSSSSDQDMPAWRRRILDRKKEKGREKELSSQSTSPSLQRKGAPTSNSKTTKESSKDAVRSTQTKAESSKTTSTTSRVPKNTSAVDEDVPDWQKRLAERKKQRELEREKLLGKSSKTADTKSSTPVKEDPKPVEPKVEISEEEQKPTASSLFDSEEELPNWQSKLANRKQQLEQKKDELGVPTSVTATERAQSEPLLDSTKETKPMSTKQEFTSSDHLLAGPSAKVTDSRNSSVSSVDEVFSTSDSTGSSVKPVPKVEPSVSSTSEDEVRHSSTPGSATVSAGDHEEEKDETPPRGCVRRTSVKFSSKESETKDDGVPEWKKKLISKKKSGQKEPTTVKSSDANSKEGDVPPFLQEFRRKRANSQARAAKGI